MQRFSGEENVDAGAQKSVPILDPIHGIQIDLGRLFVLGNSFGVNTSRGAVRNEIVTMPTRFAALHRKPGHLKQGLRQVL